ncbi:MAG: hypothetical protein Q4B23_03005 [Helcococcus sp.]|nr:hypothetical protein [Helcococcus sp.]
MKIKELNKKYFFISFVLFSMLYFILDYLNMGYSEMAKSHGFWLVLINILLNFIMAGMSAFMISLSEYVFKEKGIKTKGDNLSFLSIIFGILTYGCTPCVISFLAVFGISFSVVALPYQGLPYKLISLLLLAIGIFIMFRELKRKNCKLSF